MAKRVIAMFFALMLSLGLLFVRILSISQSEYAQAAVRNNTRTITVGSARGTFYDCNGLPLVNSEKRYVALLKPTPEALSAIEPYVDAEELSGEDEQGLSGIGPCGYRRDRLLGYYGCRGESALYAAAACCSSDRPSGRSGGERGNRAGKEL